MEKEPKRPLSYIRGSEYYLTYKIQPGVEDGEWFLTDQDTLVPPNVETWGSVRKEGLLEGTC